MHVGWAVGLAPSAHPDATELELTPRDRHVVEAWQRSAELELQARVRIDLAHHGTVRLGVGERETRTCAEPPRGCNDQVVLKVVCGGAGRK